MTHTCENSTLPHTTYAVGKNRNSIGRIEVLYKAHVLYCALFSPSCIFPPEIAKKWVFFEKCALFFSFYLKIIK